jgi:hypothetical protein
MVLRIECRMRSLLTTRALTLQVSREATLMQRIHAPPPPPPLPLLPLQQVLSGQIDQIDHQHSEVTITDNQIGITRPHLPVIENMMTEEAVAVRRLGVIIVKGRAIVVESSLSRTQIAAELLEEGVEAVALSQGLLGITIGLEIAKGTETGIAIETAIGTGIEVETGTETGTGIGVETGIGIEVETGIESIEVEDDCKVRM